MFMKAEMSQDPYDAILMDNEMPKMNGPTAAREIRSLGCQYLIVGITGNVLPEDVEQYISMGANCVLPKPLSIADLENTFRNYVLRKNSQYTAAEIQKRREEYIRKLAATLPEAPDGTGPSRPSGNSESPSGSLATVHQYGPAHSEEDGQGPAVGSATPFIGTGSSETIVNQCPRELPNASKGASLIMSSVSFRGRNSRVHSSSEDGFAALDVTPTDEFP
jgi:CheY-like chemotaxis protein